LIPFMFSWRIFEKQIFVIIITIIQKTAVMHDMRISASDAVWRLVGLASSGLIVRSPYNRPPRA
jgi:hypothetical protein